MISQLNFSRYFFIYWQIEYTASLDLDSANAIKLVEQLQSILPTKDNSLITNIRGIPPENTLGIQASGYLGEELFYQNILTDKFHRILECKTNFSSFEDQKIIHLTKLTETSLEFLEDETTEQELSLDFRIGFELFKPRLISILGFTPYIDTAFRMVYSNNKLNIALCCYRQTRINYNPFTAHEILSKTNSACQELLQLNIEKDLILKQSLKYS